MGGVLLPVQHVLEPGRERAVRLHRRGSAGRPADRRPAVRRSRRAAGVGGVRAGRSPGRTSDPSSPDAGDAARRSTPSCSASRRCSPSSTRSAARSSFATSTAGPLARKRARAGAAWSRSTRCVVMMVALWAGSLRPGVLRHHPGGAARRRRHGGRADRLGPAERGRSITRHASRSRRRHGRDADDIALFPLTIPITTGPGTISVAVALSASRPQRSGRCLPGSSSA